MMAQPIISTLGRLRQEDGLFKASLSYIVKVWVKKTKGGHIPQWLSVSLKCTKPCT